MRKPATRTAVTATGNKPSIFRCREALPMQFSRNAEAQRLEATMHVYTHQRRLHNQEKMLKTPAAIIYAARGTRSMRTSRDRCCSLFASCQPMRSLCCNRCEPKLERSSHLSYRRRWLLGGPLGPLGLTRTHVSTRACCSTEKNTDTQWLPLPHQDNLQSFLM